MHNPTIIKKRFKFHPTTRNTDLHYLIHRIGMNNLPIDSPSLLDTYLNEYCLTDNNCLQNNNGDTPLHIAARYNMLDKIYKKFKPLLPQINTIKNNQNKLPSEIIPYKPREWTYRC